MYLIAVVSDYLRDRRITYADRSESAREEELSRGVPGVGPWPLAMKLGVQRGSRFCPPAAMSFVTLWY